MTVLVLAGTAEGRRLSQALRARGMDVLASLAGATADPRPLGVPTRVGGFGGAEGFAETLSRQGIHRVIDATHPFATAIGPRSAAVCAAMGIPYLRLLRPAWQPTPEDRWHEARGEAEAAGLVPDGATVFLATGAQRLWALTGLRARQVILRVADPPSAPLPWPDARVIVGAPGEVEAEYQLFRKHGVTWMIARNSGGPAGGKLEAARRLGIEVAMIGRPPQPDAPCVDSVAAALAWADTR